tara:strand:+ start:40 stop:768 length:729 start_codon:yes stop_codon:yes gene_type:complete
MTESALTNTPEETSFSIYKDKETFKIYQAMAQSLVQSDLVPTSYQGQKGLANSLIAMDTAIRLKISPLVVMQNLNIIHGKPSWSAQFIIGMINGCGRFEELDYEEKGTKSGDDVTITACRCKAIRKKDGKEVCGSWVTMDMARQENWLKNPKWRSMPSHMLRMRAATFFGRQYVADLLLGMQTEDEIVDIQPLDITPEPKVTTEEVKGQDGERRVETKEPNGQKGERKSPSKQSKEVDDFGF